jgi:hypothetical protein
MKRRPEEESVVFVVFSQQNQRIWRHRISQPKSKPLGKTRC